MVGCLAGYSNDKICLYMLDIYKTTRVWPKIVERRRFSTPGSTLKYETGAPHSGRRGSVKMGKTRTGEFCSAINCTNCRKRCPGLSFFRFPKDPDR